MMAMAGAVNGNGLLVYARLREEEVEQWSSTPGVEVLAQAEYAGKGTGDAVYQQVWDDEEKGAKYQSVYDYSPYEIEDEELGTTTITPPKKFGAMAGT